MRKFKKLHSVSIKDYDNYTSFIVVGIFDSHKIHWDYRVITHHTTSKSDISELTNDICSSKVSNPDINDVLKYGKTVESLEDGIAYLNLFKTVWETGNNSKKEMRNMVIDNILGDK